MTQSRLIGVRSLQKLRSARLEIGLWENEVLEFHKFCTARVQMKANYCLKCEYELKCGVMSTVKMANMASIEA